MTELGFILATPGSAVRHATHRAVEPSSLQGSKQEVTQVISLVNELMNVYLAYQVPLII